MNERGYFAIGIRGSKFSQNLGSLFRTAHSFGASYIFTIGKRYGEQRTDTVCSKRHLPCFHFENDEEFLNQLPYNAHLVGVEIGEHSKPLSSFSHPERCVYVMGSEDKGLDDDFLSACSDMVEVDGGEYCMNVSVAGSIVLWDRYAKS